jgi:hypothetical protein
MSRFDLPPDDGTMQFREHVLERMRVASRGRVGAQVLADTNVNMHMEQMADSLAIGLVTQVFADKLMTEDVLLPFSETVTVDVQHDGQSFVPLFALAALFAVACPVAAPFSLTVAWTLLATLLLLTLVGLWLGVKRPPFIEHRDVRVSGTVTARMEHFATFPENNIIMPDGIGNHVRMQRISHVPYDKGGKWGVW